MPVLVYTSTTLEAEVGIGLAVITTTYHVFSLKQPERMLHAAHEYASFIALIGSLFVVAGGIHLRVKSQATPLNYAFLLIGALLANGTAVSHPCY